MMVIPIVIDALGTTPKDLVKRLTNQRTRRDHPDHRIFKVGQNTGKSPSDLRRPAVTQIPVKGQQLILV